ncbi:MAG: hypothetical protein AMXMBFR82_01760 [Candidatus Hydrogenedentota bacterium]
MLMVVGFALFWTTSARAMGAPVIFTLFGIVFTMMAISGFVAVVIAFVKGGAPGAVVHDEPEPVELYRPEPEAIAMHSPEPQYRSCTYCGTRVDGSAHRCPNCGAGI